MLKKVLITAALALVMLSLLAALACSNQSAADNVKVKQSSIQAQVTGDSVSIPVSEVDRLTNTRFRVSTATDTLTFMAYKYDSKLYVRSDICPPCGSESFTLTGGTLVCDTCGTVFKADTGAGVKGACVKYVKQPVNYEIKGSDIVMRGVDLTTAFRNTLNPPKS